MPTRLPTTIDCGRGPRPRAPPRGRRRGSSRGSGRPRRVRPRPRWRRGTLMRNGTKRTFTAPRPSIAMASPMTVAEERRRPADDPKALQRRGPDARMRLAGRDRRTPDRSTGSTRGHDQDRCGEGRGVEGEGRPVCAARRDDHAGGRPVPSSPPIIRLIWLDAVGRHQALARDDARDEGAAGRREECPDRRLGEGDERTGAAIARRSRRRRSRGPARPEGCPTRS